MLTAKLVRLETPWSRTPQPRRRIALDTRLNGDSRRRRPPSPGRDGCITRPSWGLLLVMYRSGCLKQDAQFRQAASAGRADAAHRQPELVGDLRVGYRRIGH